MQKYNIFTSHQSFNIWSLFEENTSGLCPGVKEEKFEKRMVFHNTLKKCSFGLWMIIF